MRETNRNQVTSQTHARGSNGRTHPGPIPLAMRLPTPRLPQRAVDERVAAPSSDLSEGLPSSASRFHFR